MPEKNSDKKTTKSKSSSKSHHSSSKSHSTNKNDAMQQMPRDVFFRGRYALIRFEEDPGPGDTSTVWLVDTKKKTLRPFLSDDAFNAYYKGSTTVKDEDKKGTIKSVPLDYLAPDGPLRNFRMLQDNDGIGGDGSFPQEFAEDIDETKLENKYGQTENPEAEQTAIQILDGLLAKVKTSPQLQIDPGTIDTVAKDPKVISFYINALAYGGYTPLDVIKDLKRRSAMGASQTPNIQNDAAI